MKAFWIQWDTDGENHDLPAEIEIPKRMTDEDVISDYITEQTGFCHFGFSMAVFSPTDIEKIIKTYVEQILFLHDMDIQKDDRYKEIYRKIVQFCIDEINENQELIFQFINKEQIQYFVKKAILFMCKN